jgi:hypothetical protein
MAKEKSLVEEAILSMKNLEEAVAENAKGILASTMKEEIKELVKESLSEQEEDEIETDVDMEEPEMEEPEMDDEEGMDMDMDNPDDEPIDLTKKSDAEVLRVFQLMGPDDQIVVTKDDSGNINLKDNESNKEYMIVGESDDEFMGDADIDAMEGYGMMEDDDLFGDSEIGDMSGEMAEDDFESDKSGSDVKSIIQNIFDEQYDEEDEEMLDEPSSNPWDKLDSDLRNKFGDKYDKGEVFMDYPEDHDFGDSEEENEGVMYEIEMSDDSSSMGVEEDDDMDDVVYEIEMTDEEVDEDDNYIEEAMKKIKAKGTGMGSASKFKYGKVNEKGFNTKMKQGPKSVGTGKPKFEYDKSGENLDGEFKIKPKVKKAETKEASRTYGNGSKQGRGLRKGITPNRNLTFESVDSGELQILREKNEEYRKALNVFRNKLNEVAVFNSNLAYATRLFTEHSTSKQEKINILRRFDGVETLKESKNLYKIIKDELSGSNAQPMNESFERKIEKAPSSGSAVNLIESKTYENPQFLRMKDLMTKIK